MLIKQNIPNSPTINNVPTIHCITVLHCANAQHNIALNHPPIVVMIAMFSLVSFFMIIYLCLQDLFRVSSTPELIMVWYTYTQHIIAPLMCMLCCCLFFFLFLFLFTVCVFCVVLRLFWYVQDIQCSRQIVFLSKEFFFKCWNSYAFMHPIGGISPIYYPTGICLPSIPHLHTHKKYFYFLLNTHIKFFIKQK